MTGTRHTRLKGVPNIKSPAQGPTIYPPNGALGYTTGQSWGALKRCWRGYMLALMRDKKPAYDHERAMLYAKRIRKLQAELAINIAEFPDLGLYGKTIADIEWDCP